MQNNADQSSTELHKVRKVHRQWIGIFIAFWIVLAGVCAVVASRWGIHWIELLNGATLPEPFSASGSPTAERGGWFYAILGLRTLLNLGVLFTAIGVGYVFYRGVEGMIMSRLNPAFRTSNITLAEDILQFLHDRHVEVPVKVEEEVREYARKFGSDDETSFIALRINRGPRGSARAAHD